MTGSVQPGFKCGGTHDFDLEVHDGVVKPAELRALPWENPGLCWGEGEGVDYPRLGIATEVKRIDVEAVDHVTGGQDNLGGDTLREHQGGILGGLPYDCCIGVTWIAELPTPLEGVYMDCWLRYGHCGHFVLCSDSDPNEASNDDGRDDGVENLHGNVILRLLRNACIPRAVSQRSPDDERKRETTHDEANDHELLPEFVGGLSLRGGTFGSPETRHGATSEQDGRRGDKRYEASAVTADTTPRRCRSSRGVWGSFHGQDLSQDRRWLEQPKARSQAERESGPNSLRAEPCALGPRKLPEGS